MASAHSAAGGRPLRRRDLQKEQTRRDLALAAFNLARAHGLANVRISQIATAVGVSPRTFNNYFPSKEAAVIWPVTLQARWLAAAWPTGDVDAFQAHRELLHQPECPGLSTALSILAPNGHTAATPSRWAAMSRGGLTRISHPGSSPARSVQPSGLAV